MVSCRHGRCRSTHPRDTTVSGSVWSCYSHLPGAPEEARYADALGQRYDFDSNVINHKKVAVGDILVIRDRHLVYGYGVVEAVEQRPGIKMMNRCPNCRSSDLATRKRLLPAHRCNDCSFSFDQPNAEPMSVMLYSATYLDRWFPFDSPVPLRALEGVYAQKDRQNAIRLLEPVAAHALMRSHTDVEGYVQLELVAAREGIDGGHVEAVVRRRVGQHRFREQLLERFGSTCAVTGSQPDAVLDAAHLYSFAEQGSHEDDGGLLLRADVHRMFDRLLITFDPRTWRSAVAPPVLKRHRHLQRIHDQPIAVPGPLLPRAALIQEHHRAAKERWRDIA